MVARVRRAYAMVWSIVIVLRLWPAWHGGLFLGDVGDVRVGAGGGGRLWRVLGSLSRQRRPRVRRLLRGGRGYARAWAISSVTATRPQGMRRRSHRSSDSACGAKTSLCVASGNRACQPPRLIRDTARGEQGTGGASEA